MRIAPVQRRALLACAVGVVAHLLAAERGSQPGASRFYASDTAADLVSQGLALPAPAGPEAAAFQIVTSPSIRNVPNEAQATTAPWIDSNAWRFQRGLAKAHYLKLPRGSAALAAAEAFTFGVDAILNPDVADAQELGNMLRFLRLQAQPPMPPMANIGIVDDRSPAMDEVLNMLTRRNLLYRVVPAPDRKLDLTVQLGSRDFPREAASNPSEFAARVRAKLGDDRRLVRVYGTSTVLVRLTGDARKARLYILDFSRNRNQQNQPGVRLRVLGRYQPVRFAAYGVRADAALADITHPDKATEFTLPAPSIISIIDLNRQ